MRRIRFLLRVVIVVAIAVLGYQCAQKPLDNYKSLPVYTEDKLYVVTKVIDGDTLELEGGRRLRLIGIDAPEEYPNEKAARDSMRTGQDVRTITAMGKRSTEFVKGLLRAKPATKVRLEYDVEKKDKYGRLLAYVFVDTGMPVSVQYKTMPGMIYQDIGETTYLFLNATLVASGYAYTLTIAPNVKYAQMLRELYDEAREGQRGLWYKK